MGKRYYVVFTVYDFRYNYEHESGQDISYEVYILEVIQEFHILTYFAIKNNRYKTCILTCILSLRLFPCEIITTVNTTHRRSYSN